MCCGALAKKAILRKAIIIIAILNSVSASEASKVCEAVVPVWAVTANNLILVVLGGVQIWALVQESPVAVAVDNLREEVVQEAKTNTAELTAVLRRLNLPADNSEAKEPETMEGGAGFAPIFFRYVFPTESMRLDELEAKNKQLRSDLDKLKASMQKKKTKEKKPGLLNHFKAWTKGLSRRKEPDDMIPHLSTSTQDTA
jgi:hypothetical protein